MPHRRGAGWRMTMDHDFTGRTWAEHHQQSSASIAALIDKVAYAFKRLNALQYDAPWRHARRTLI
jgi:hypothetical protein